jgi:hypothetical protein
VTLALAWGAIALIAGGLAYRWRQRVLRLCALVVCGGIALVAAVAVTGAYSPDVFLQATRIFAATVLLSIVAVLLIGRSLPQVVSKHDRNSVAVVFGAMAAMYLAVAGFLASAATEQWGLANLPQVRSRDEFIKLRDAPGNPGAILLEARVSGAMPDLGPPSHSGVVASYRCSAIGPIRLPASDQRLPARYLLDLPGGPPVVTGGIGSGDQAWAWPGDGSGQCMLVRGDPAVAWGRLRAGMGNGGPTSYTGLTDVRAIAAGDIETFLSEYVPVAERTYRVVGALAVLNGVLAAAMVGIGLMAFRRLARTGTDTPPMIRWRSGSR